MKTKAIILMSLLSLCLFHSCGGSSESKVSPLSDKYEATTVSYGLSSEGENYYGYDAWYSLMYVNGHAYELVSESEKGYEYELSYTVMDGRIVDVNPFWKNIRFSELNDQQRLDAAQSPMVDYITVEGDLYNHLEKKLLKIDEGCDYTLSENYLKVSRYKVKPQSVDTYNGDDLPRIQVEIMVKDQEFLLID